jgi:hypothetical protein
MALPYNEIPPAPAVQSLSPVGYAWLELYFAQMAGMNISLCSFCGEAFSLHGKGGNALNKGVCGKETCNKSSRKQRDNKNFFAKGEEIKEQNRLRKKKERAYKYIEIEKKEDVWEFSKRNDLDPLLVKGWIDEMKIKKNIYKK